MSTITLTDLTPKETGELRPPFLVPLGKTVIGREPYLQCTIPAVSRTHALLEAKKGELILKSTHKKPCFYQRRGDTEKEVLRLDESVSLRDGDVFFMIDSGLGYKVQITDSQPKESGKQDEAEATPSSPADVAVEDEQKSPSKRKFPQWMEEAELNSKAKTQKGAINKTNEDKTEGTGEPTESEPVVKPNMEKRAKDTRRHDMSDEGEDVEATTEVPLVAPQAEVEMDTSNVPQESLTDATGSNDNALQTEECQDAAQEEDKVAGGTSGHVSDAEEELGAVGNDSQNTAHQVASSSTQTVRQACKYGARCYRKNPQHLVDFSHPNDPDYTATTPTANTGPKPVCPYGTSCYRRNPQHIQDYDHTQPPAQPSSPTQRPARKAKKKAKKNTVHWDSGSEDSYESSFVDSSDEYNPDEDSDLN